MAQAANKALLAAAVQGDVAAAAAALDDGASTACLNQASPTRARLRQRAPHRASLGTARRAGALVGGALGVPGASAPGLYMKELTRPRAQDDAPPLLVAANAGHAAVITLLLERGADVNFKHFVRCKRCVQAFCVLRPARPAARATPS